MNPTRPTKEYRKDLGSKEQDGTQDDRSIRTETIGTKDSIQGQRNTSTNRGVEMNATNGRKESGIQRNQKCAMI